MLVPLALSGQAELSVDDIVEKTRTNVIEVWQLMPDFVCKETITSRSFDNRKLKKEIVIESIFAATGDGIGSIHETREATSIDGKPVKKGTAIPPVPLMSTDLTLRQQGSFLISPFFMNSFKLMGTEPIRDHTAWKIQSSGVIPGFDVKVEGTAWIDTGSMQVLRVDTRYVEVPSNFAWKSRSTSAEYAPVEIGGKQFWLPQIVKAERTKNSNQNDGPTESYMAEYSGCKKYGASVELKFGEAIVAPPQR
jgi:hypothetical protein